MIEHIRWTRSGFRKEAFDSGHFVSALIEINLAYIKAKCCIAAGVRNIMVIKKENTIHNSNWDLLPVHC